MVTAKASPRDCLGHVMMSTCSLLRVDSSPRLDNNNHQSAMSMRRQISALTRRSPGADWNRDPDFFRFTRGRFVCKEAEQMAQRQVNFDMDELCKVAEDTVGKQCARVEKFADGLYNKALLLTMHDNHQVVAKVPNPNAGLPHFTTASEVATMDMVLEIRQ